MGASCTDTIPRLSPGQGTCILIVNILIGGWGTMYATCMSDHYEYIQVCIGFAQLLIPLGGYIWAIIWGIKIYDKSHQSLWQPKIIATSSREMIPIQAQSPGIQGPPAPYIQSRPPPGPPMRSPYN